MKTAEEWINHWAVTESSCRQKGETFFNWEARRLKEAQLDAYRAGMMRAAEIAEGETFSAGEHTSWENAYNKGCKDVELAILTAANNLKPEDLK